jgi:hypothetical protein
MLEEFNPAYKTFFDEPHYQGVALRAAIERAAAPKLATRREFRNHHHRTLGRDGRVLVTITAIAPNADERLPRVSSQTGRRPAWRPRDC